MPEALYRPSRDEFRALAQGFTIVPVWREVLADTLTPVGALKRLATSEYFFLLETVEQGQRWDRYSFFGVDPFLVVTSVGADVAWHGEPPTWASGAAPLDIIESTIAGYRAPNLPGLPPLRAGAVGFLGYDVIRQIEHLPNQPPDDRGLPDIALQFADRLVVFDHFRNVVSVICNAVPGDDPDAAYDAAVRRCEDVVARLAGPIAETPIPPPEVVRQEPPDSSVTRERWKDMIETAREYIRAGDIFQVVLSQRFEIETGASPIDVYRMLRLVNPSPYMYLLRFGDVWIVGSSPEALVRVDGRRAVTHPIAGTRRRLESDPEHDARMEAELLADAKERAEHVMLVDLARNDLGRVCEYGSVEVTRLLEVERYSHLMHMVSEVTGTLREDVTAFDVLRATFPAGTVSGAPKVRAMEIIDELEPTKRGPYAGVVGYFDFSGNLNTAILLRTAVIRGTSAWVQAGGGIVADSNADDEYLESVNKASAVINAIRAAEQFT